MHNLQAPCCARKSGHEKLPEGRAWDEKMAINYRQRPLDFYLTKWPSTAVRDPGTVCEPNLPNGEIFPYLRRQIQWILQVTSAAAGRPHVLNARVRISLFFAPALTAQLLSTKLPEIGGTSVRENWNVRKEPGPVVYMILFPDQESQSPPDTPDKSQGLMSFFFSFLYEAKLVTTHVGECIAASAGAT
jgi:hypothetical protein